MRPNKKSSIETFYLNKISCRIHPEMADFLGYLLLKLALRIRADFEAGLKIHGVLAPQIAMLVLLKRLGPMTQVELGQHLDIDKATIVRFLDGLESGQYLARQAHESDRRAKVLVLTKAGHTLAEKSAKLREKVEKNLLANLSPNEKAQFRKLVSKLTLFEAPGPQLQTRKKSKKV